jgi:hypothetical protein
MTTTTSKNSVDACQILEMVRRRREETGAPSAIPVPIPAPEDRVPSMMDCMAYALPPRIKTAIHEQFEAPDLRVTVWPTQDSIIIQRFEGSRRRYEIPHAHEWTTMMNEIEETVLQMLDHDALEDTETQEWSAYFNRISGGMV